MQLVVKNQRISLDKQDVIGDGGESVIFRYGTDHALKIYRDPNAKRMKKLDDFFRMGFKLPDNVLAPLFPAYDEKMSLIIGFGMARLPSNSQPVAKLSSRDFCMKQGFTTKDVARFCLGMCRTLASIHKAGIIAGDVNDQNEQMQLVKLLDYWIDVDSFQFGSHPCMAGTEEYLCPDLYGIDLSKRPVFREEHDWYSFAVLLFRSLLRVHPFRANHPKFKSIMSCAKNGVTVLDKGIQYPKIGLPPEILSDDMAEVLLSYLKRRKSGPFPADKLDSYFDILVECRSCGIWYPGMRPNCPGCATKNIVDMKLAAKVAGLESETLIMTQGKIIFFQVVDTTLYCLADEGGTTVLYKKSKGRNAVRKELFKTRYGAQYGIFEKMLVVCPDPAADSPGLYVLDIEGPSPKPVLQSTTEKLEGKGAVYGCTETHLYRIVGPLVMRSELFAGSALADREVIQALPGQTWFTVSQNRDDDKELLLGFYRILGELKWFLVKSENNVFERFDVNMPALSPGESISDISIRFSKSSVLVMRETRKRGVDFVRVDVVKADDGTVAQSYAAKVSDADVYESIHGRAYSEGIIMHPTDNGIVRETISDQKREPIPATSQYVKADDKLYKFGQDILVLTDDRVMAIRTTR